jgi:hypothetical protein
MDRRAEDRVGPERRRTLRFPFTASIEAIEEKSGTRINGRISDLGLGGCYVDALNPFPVGALLSIKITKDKESFEAKAKVVYSLVGMGMGLAFIAADPNQVKLFQRWIFALNGGKPPARGAAEGGPAKTAAAEAPAKSAAVENKGDEAQYVLNDLIVALMRKGVLDKEDGNAMLRKLNR